MENYIDARPYLFTSKRLGFRTWQAQDLEPMSRLNADPDVMHFFPRLLSVEQTKDFTDRMNAQYEQTGFCYFAVDRLDQSQFIGFIGLDRKTFLSDFTPCIDIGWRLDKQHWNKGFASEGALRCIDYAFKDLHINKILAMAPLINLPSIKVMLNIGMKQAAIFKHPLLLSDERLVNCVLYEKLNPAYRQ